MSSSTPAFSIQVEGVKGVCPAGEAWATENIRQRRIPVFSCDGPCIRGEIARLAANQIAKETPSCARACQEVWCVPHSTMARWAREADAAIMIDGCFLKCHGRILEKLLDAEKVIHFDALPLYNKYTDVYLMDDVPEAERRGIARQVAGKIMAKLSGEERLRGH